MKTGFPTLQMTIENIPSYIGHRTSKKLHFWRLRLRSWRFGKATSVPSLSYFGWRLRLRLWRQTTTLPLVFHFIFSYHISSHIKTLFGSIHRKSFMTIHSKLICMRLRFWFLPTSTYQSTYEHFNSFLHNIAILQRRGGGVVWYYRSSVLYCTDSRRVP